VGPDVKLQVGVRSEPREPSPISPTEGEAYAVVARSVRSVHPGAVVAPYLVLGGTDARHYHRISENVYRFLPFELGPEATTLPHGTNERISIDNLVRAVRFYTRLIREAAGNAQSSSE
jgi:carboxypeptidase PM20D1